MVSLSIVVPLPVLPRFQLHWYMVSLLPHWFSLSIVAPLPVITRFSAGSGFPVAPLLVLPGFQLAMVSLSIVDPLLLLPAFQLALVSLLPHCRYYHVFSCTGLPIALLLVLPAFQLALVFPLNCGPIAAIITFSAGTGFPVAPLLLLSRFQLAPVSLAIVSPLLLLPAFQLAVVYL